MKKVSVIIPVYNVQESLEFCLDSVIAQSYSNLEIILVDDGSTDTSLSICEKYQQMDSRIKTITQKNKGLSGARNSGLCIATGDFVAFIDSDDYVSSDFIESLLLQMDDDIFITVCKSKIVYDYKQEYKLRNKTSQKLVYYYNFYDYCKLVFSDVRFLSAWGKLYRRELFDVIKFPEGKLHEDIYIMGDLLFQTPRICLIDSENYFYVKRKGSITTGKFSKRKFDLVEANNIFINKVLSLYPDLWIESKVYELHATSSSIKQMSRDDAKQYRQFISLVIKDARENLIKVIASSKICKNEKVLMVITSTNYLFIKLCWILYDSIKKTKIILSNKMWEDDI